MVGDVIHIVDGQKIFPGKAVEPQRQVAVLKAALHLFGQSPGAQRAAAPVAVVALPGQIGAGVQQMCFPEPLRPAKISSGPSWPMLGQMARAAAAERARALPSRYSKLAKVSCRFVLKSIFLAPGV